MRESSARRATMGKSNNKSSRSSSAKFKHRFSRMLLGSSCTTTTMAATTLGQAKLPSATPQRLESELFPDPDCRRRRKLDHHAPFSATDPRRLRHVAPVVSISINCGARRFVQTSDPFLPLVNKEEEHDTERKTEAKQRSKRASETKKKTKRAEAKKLLPDAYGFIISSSTDSENQLNLLSSDEEEEESATLLSSNSFSSDSSEFFHNSRKKNTKSTGRPARRHEKHSKELRPLVSIASKEREQSRERRESNAGFAVVKRSSDPYSDFKSSMVELIVERGMHRARDLERLLDAYLSLNSHRHHQAILEAFDDICEAMYGK